MTNLLKTVAVFFAVLCAAYFFLIDGIIKSQLEHQGALALQVPLSIGSVTFHLMPTSLTLRAVQIGNTQLPIRDPVLAPDRVRIGELSLPLSLRDLLAHKLIIDTVDVYGLRFDRARSGQNASAPAPATHSPPLREALQHVQQMLNQPLTSSTLEPGASITSAIVADQVKPLLTQITTALTALTASSVAVGDWQILARHVNIDGVCDIGNNSLRFAGTIENVTPQPQLFDAVTQWDLRSAGGEPATLRIDGRLDKRKLAQVMLHFDLSNFSLAQWPLSDDSELRLAIANARADIQAALSLTGNQFDLHVNAHFQPVRFDVVNNNDAVARAIADVWRRTAAFDLTLQASGDLQNPALKLNSSLDAPLTAALQQLQPASAFPQAMPFSNSP